MTATDIVAGAMKAGEKQFDELYALIGRLENAWKHGSDGGTYLDKIGQILDRPLTQLVRKFGDVGITRDATGTWSEPLFEELKRKGAEWRAKHGASPASTAAGNR